MVDLIGQFVSNLILLVIGGIIAYFTVNKYQKSKEEKEIREKIAILHSKFSQRLFDLILAWHEWVKDVEDKSNKKELKKTYFGLLSMDLVFFTRLIIQFELNMEDADEINIFQTNLKELAPKLNSCIENHQKTRKVSKDILKMLTEMSTTLKNTINIILLNKIK